MLQIMVILFLLLENGQVRALTAGDRHQIALTCIEQTGVLRTAVEQAIAGHIPEHDGKYKDFLACSYKKQGFQSETGEILIDNLKEFLQPLYRSSDLSGIDSCTGSKKKTHAENAFDAMHCVITFLKKIEEQ